MTKDLNITEMIKTLAEGEDSKTLERFIEKLVEKYPTKAARIAKELKLKDEFDDNNVFVTSARVLSESQKKKIEERFNKKYPYTLNYIYRVDESILGGIHFKKGEIVISNTLESRARTLIEKIKMTDLSRGNHAK